MTVVDDQHLAALLRSAQIPEPHVDVERAVRDGRRRRRRRRVGGLAAMTVLTAFGVVGAVQLTGAASPPAPTTPALAVSPAGPPRSPRPRRSPARRPGCRSRSPVRSRWRRASTPPGGTSSVTSAPGRRTGGSCCGPTVGPASCRPPWSTRRRSTPGRRGRHQRRRHRLGLPERQGALPGHPGYQAVLLHAINGRGDIVGTARERTSRTTPCGGRRTARSSTDWSASGDRPRPGSPRTALSSGHRANGPTGGRRRAPGGAAGARRLPRASIESARGEWAIGMVPGERRGSATLMLPVLWNLATGTVRLLPFPSTTGIAANGDLLTGDGARWSSPGRHVPPAAGPSRDPGDRGRHVHGRGDQRRRSDRGRCRLRRRRTGHWRGAAGGDGT
ncbi:hypothetical protein NKG94_03085 [Micromonospora sp. M12]